MAKPVRRNIAHLTDAERTKYIDAVVKADQRFWSGGPVSYWDFQDLSHQTTHVHGGPKFLLWHRELCNRWEALLQEIDPDVALHYWDWTTDPRSSPNGAGGTTDLSADSFMGTMTGNVAGKLLPLHNQGVLAGSRDQTGQPQDPPQTLLRSMPVGPGTIATDASILSSSVGSIQSEQWRAFRLRVEQVHGGVHVRFGPGNIGDPTGHDAFQDPFVFMLHSNVDRLFAMWQCEAGQEWRLDVGQVYGVETSVSGEDALTGNTLAPWDGTSGAFPFTPAGGLIKVKSYLDPSLVVPPCYDTLPLTVSKAAPTGSTPMRFLDVAEGSSTARALRVEIHGCDSVHINGVLTGDPAFTLHQASVQSPVPAGFSTSPALMWVKYKAGAAGSIANGHLTATCPETGTVFDVDIVANAIAKPKVAVSAVLDSSGSMSLPSGVSDFDRMKVLHLAAPTFVALLGDDDGIGVVSFDTDATSVTAVQTAQPLGFGGGRDAAFGAIAAQATNPFGMTAIGDGVEAAHNQLLAASAGFDHQAILVFTDGDETEAKYISQVAGLINERVYAVGLGTASQLNPAGLKAITDGTNGYLTLTNALGTDGVMQLAKYFTQVLAGVTNAQIITDPAGYVMSGVTEKVPFSVTDADQRCDVIVLSDAPEALILTLTAPDGTTVTAGPDAVELVAPAMICLRLPLPVASNPGAHGGAWTANIDLDDRRFKRYLANLEERKDVAGIQRAQAHGLPYSLTIHSVSDLAMSAVCTQLSHTPGSNAHLRATLTDSGIPLEHQARVTALVTAPDGSSRVVPLTESDPGVFDGDLTLAQAGIYPTLIRAVGTSFSGHAFTREELRTPATWIDPVPPPTTDPGGHGSQAWCDLLLCLLEPDRAGRALEERGVNIDGVRDCIERFCS